MRVPITAAAGIMLLLGASLQGCGHKGPLFLPPPKATAAQSAAQPVPQSAVPTTSSNP
jgi:predicted small lipoprotein YifL